MTATVAEVRPLAVRVLRVSGWFTLGLAMIALVLGAVQGFDDLAVIWAIIGIGLLSAALAALLGTRPSSIGFVAAVVACSMLVFFPPIPIAIALIASQTRPQLLEYYGIRRRSA